ncbi:hypothetical protein GCM10010967_17800 [Dyadobacter beijingensis]|uniref:Uncharacterized protein n=1 Tax=Dyadobacter beijingensis TaxID=365489 RepID=A0ABQ2HM93_9BACT|nr:hypothetical protein GCM10010967_17800 [Dyadobacter beijingensis]
MLATYHTTSDSINTKLIEDIKKRFSENDKLTITVVSEERTSHNDKLLEFSEIEQRFPLRTVSLSLDFNDIIQEINL